MRRFDSICVVDWSAGNDTGPRPRPDAIWAAVVGNGEAEEPVYLRNRVEALDWLNALIERELQEGRRLLLGFDFPFGYPTGFAERIVGGPLPLKLWDHIAERLKDTPKANSRFDLAGEINASFDGVGPFWFNGLRRDISDLPRLGLDRRDHGMTERREIEKRLGGTFTVWQMGGAGAVGGQVMTGVVVLSKLRKRFGDAISVWPFEADTAPVRFVEIWPTLINEAVLEENDTIRDRAQVRCLARALSRVPAERLAEMMEVDAPEEGWILGAGFETELLEYAWPS